MTHKINLYKIASKPHMIYTIQFKYNKHLHQLFQRK